ncbi:DUF429 domain-containing protein [Parvibaculum sp.]|uniref:DUF429 domain-containing protein n=1 Tax=Parvibaculum sp. TaxID=2024848 RepID=UPI00391B4996
MAMRAVLGIDAAWTLTQPSGVALATNRGGRWCLTTAVPSYQSFLALADRSLKAEPRPSGSAIDVPALLAAAETLAGSSVDLIAVDMPLAHSSIVGRRTSDNIISRIYGGRKCSTHSPSSLRPGRVSDELRKGFARSGYPLQTIRIDGPGLIEVYPHPALVELTDAPERLPYKVSKAGKYWKSATPMQRRTNLVAQWDKIAVALDEELSGVSAAFPNLGPSASGWSMKALEDMLDAVVCAWVGICAIEGRAAPFGDEDSAIWVPVTANATASGEASGSRE